MKYEPSLPEHNDNIAPGSDLKDFVVLLSGLLALALLVFWLLGMLVDVAVDELSPEAEAYVHSLFADAAAKAPPGTGPAAADEARLQAVVDGLTRCAGLQLPTRVRLVQSDAPNAVVFHGGQIVVMSGLLPTLRSENGLAFVLAHELAHIVQRDHLRGMGRAIVLFAISSALTGDASALSGILTPALQVGQSGHSREREALADDAALRTLQCRYGHVGGATEFFESLKKVQGEELPLAHAIASHPALQARIQRTLRRAREHGYRHGPTIALQGYASRK